MSIRRFIKSIGVLSMRDHPKAPEGMEPFFEQEFEWLSAMVAWEFRPAYWTWRMKFYAMLRYAAGTYFLPMAEKKREIPPSHIARMHERPLARTTGERDRDPQLIDSIITPILK